MLIIILKNHSGGKRLTKDTETYVGHLTPQWVRQMRVERVGNPKKKRVFKPLNHFVPKNIMPD